MLLGTSPSGSKPSAQGHVGHVDEAFTLIELMAVVAIIAILGAVALPTLMRDNIASRFKGAVRHMAQDIQRARYEALSNRESRSIDLIDAHHYSLQAVVPGVMARSLLASRQLENQIEIYGISLQAVLPETSPPAPLAIPAEIQITSTAEVLARVGAPGATPPLSAEANGNSVTIWMRAKDANNNVVHRARVVIFRTTGFAKIYGESLNAGGGVVSRW